MFDDMFEKQKGKIPRAIPHLNDDVIFQILSHLPTQSLIKFKAVYRSWNRMISSPVFAQEHSSRLVLTPFSGIFVKWRPRPQALEPLFGNIAGISTTASRLLASDFEVVASTNGLICLYRSKDEVFIVGNPSTSQWSVLPKLDVRQTLIDIFHGAVLMYEPAKSLHYKLIYAVLSPRDEPRDADGTLRFYIFSSETSSWKTSSEFLFLLEKSFWIYSHCYQFHNIGGGAVCWYDCGIERVFGYEVDTDTLWSIALPTSEENMCGNMVGSGGSIYFLVDTNYKMLCWRLEGKERWVLEGEACKPSRELFYPLLAYDPAERVVITQDNVHSTYLTGYHLPTAARTIALPALRGEYVRPVIPHIITLAPFHGAEAHTQDAIQRLYKDFLGLDSLFLLYFRSSSWLS